MKWRKHCIPSNRGRRFHDRMGRAGGLISFLMLVSILFLPGYNKALAEESEVAFDLESQSLSVEAEEAPLKSVMEEIAKEGEVWITGQRHLSGEEISVEFEDEPVRTGLERLLSDINYCLIFDSFGSLSGIILVGKKSWKSRRLRTQRRKPARPSRSQRRSKRRR